MKRIAFLLAALLALGLMSCGGTSPAPAGETAGTASETQPAVTTAADDPGLPQKNFDGAGINFLVISEKHNANNYSQEIYAEKENGDPLNDAVYYRNVYVEDLYGTKITETRADDPAGSARTAVLAGEDLYQVLMMGMDECMTIAQMEALYNLNEVEYLDLSRAWWDQNVNGALTCRGTSYMAVGDINIMDDNATWVTFFNKKLAEDYTLPDFYGIADEGKWTMDVLLENARITNTDLNGDNEITWEDRFGIGTDKYNFSNLLMGAGERYWNWNDAGDLEPVIYNDRAVAVMEKIFTLMYDEPTTVNSDQYWGIVSGTPNSTVLRKSFGEDRMTFYIASMLTYSLMRSMESDFGLLPMPKYDEAQESYHSPILPRNTSALSIPITNADTAMTGYLVEAMAAKSSTTLRPAYYTYTIEGKGLRDEDSARMLDIVLSTKIVDFGSVFDFGDMVAAFQNLTLTNGTDIASTYASRIDAAKIACEETMARLYPR